MQEITDPVTNWYVTDNAEEINSPALLIYPDRVEENIRRMIDATGDINRIRPHVKTHKMSGIIRLQIEYGIYKFKCATIAEAEMTAVSGAKDVLLAYQPVGPNIERFFRLRKEFPDTKFSCIADSREVIQQLSDKAVMEKMEIQIWLDINNGMNRTGVLPGKAAASLYKMINDLPMLKAAGLHVYDGHIHERDFSLRSKLCNDAFKPVTDLIEAIHKQGFLSVSVIAGGTPTFPFHAKRAGVEVSPGTLLLWDYGYSSTFIDMDYLHAAILFTRIVSKPAKDLICLDLGHKAVASEMPQPRIKLFGLDDYNIIGHNEEHMVIRTAEAVNLKIGDILYAVPYHICPTVDRYDSVSVVKEGKVSEQWNVEARKRRITV